MDRFSLVIALLVLATGPAQANGRHAPNSDYEILVPNIELRPGVAVDINVRVFVNEDRPCRWRTYFAVHGGLHTSATWEPLAEALFDDNPGGLVACRIAAIDLIGRGGSSLPSGITFGEITLEDQATAVLATLESLRNRGMWVSTLVAQSQGALIVQIAQQRLIDEGTSLWRKFFIPRAIMLTPAAPDAVPWFLADNGVGELLVSLFTVMNPPPLGDIVAFDDLSWISFNFTTECCGIVATAPTPDEVAAKGYNTPEPLASSQQIVGIAPFARPQVDAGIFQPWRGTRLSVVGYSEDTTILAFENLLTYAYLTWDMKLKRFALITDPVAVHAMHISDPELLLERAKPRVRF